ncbi:hypothetical protein [Acetivibrio saccincola]|nr:hypothetical protein [Acetivibrio saccincola]
MQISRINALLSVIIKWTLYIPYVFGLKRKNTWPLDTGILTKSIYK